MFTISIISKPNEKSRQVRTDTHKSENFPNWFDMIGFCAEDGIRAADFEHRRLSDRAYAGRFVWTDARYLDPRIRGCKRFGVKFYVFSDRPITLKDLVR